ncbi:MAG TPA: twin-arginine translocation signal domain-containing protein, partial [Vicinamibacterales bacterium]
MRDKGHVSTSRRRFLQAVPVAVAGAVTSTAWAQQSTDTPGSVTTDTVRAAEAIDGLKFTSAEETAALRGINNNLAAYQRVRDMKIPQDVEPAHI